jgi:CHASE3 domain sensor protein
MTMRHHDLLRWLPVAASLGLVVLIVIISIVSVRELKQATNWRKQTFQAVLEAQQYEDTLIEGETHVRGYVAAGAPNLLIEYQSETNAEMREYVRLAELTKKDPEQQERLKALHAAVKAVFDYDDNVIAVYARQGSQAALKLEDSAKATGAADSAVKDLEGFKAEEEKLLDKRDQTEETDYHKATSVLTIGSILAAILLVLSTFIASRETARRRKAEEEQRGLIMELQQTLAQVKTLSGLIPICGWCKKVRSDKGFWQSVEHYVSQQTGAKFSHGMCPLCAKNWQKSIPKAEFASATAKSPVGR